MRPPVIARTPGDVLDATLGAVTVGLVPTMGALHEGHLSLIRRSDAENDDTVVSIFVNPTQFNDPDDLTRYPRTPDADIALAHEAGARIFYMPAVETVYPAGFATRVHVEGVTERWEGASRPGHFDGVATIVSILLNQLQPTRAYFGEKDFQQLAMVRRMHRDLSLAGEIVGCPTVRDPDGLALSSRNARLSAEERAAALVLPATLFSLQTQAREGNDDVSALTEAGRALIGVEPLVALDYLAIVDPETLEPAATLVPGARAIVAATVGGTRLIDNVPLRPVEPS
ncbi:MAG TPA: pantoate--beta-alanine ligase [Thermomicrobiales bacterium]|nr:pantoate--beta-alanine ligase [Thermomicrobiales bacterium]